MPLTPAPDPAAPSTLPPAVPPLDRDFDHACRELGRALLYVAQLSTLLNERATETNRLDDGLQTARLRIQELERETQALRGQLEVAEAALHEGAADAVRVPADTSAEG